MFFAPSPTPDFWICMTFLYFVRFLFNTLFQFSLFYLLYVVISENISVWITIFIYTYIVWIYHDKAWSYPWYLYLMVTQRMRAWRKISLFGKKIRFMTALDLMPWSDRITKISPYVRNQFLSYHLIQIPWILPAL